MAKIEHRDGTSTEGRGLGHSFAADNVDRGDPDLNVFKKRRLNFPLSDNPRAREIGFENQRVPEEINTLRAYRDLVPIEGQDPLAPKKVIRVGSIKDLRPELPDRSIDSAAIEAAQEAERSLLLASDFGRLFPEASILEPLPGQTFNVGQRITIKALGKDIRAIFSATLFVDNQPVDRRNLDRRDQEPNREHTFIFLYDIPASRNPGPMDIMVRVFDIESSTQGIILDDAVNSSPTQFRGGVSSLDGRIGRLGSTSKTNPQLDVDPSQFLRTPEGIALITINII